jgi:5-methylcytosine-specific restriction endonuclease McrA
MTALAVTSTSPVLNASVLVLNKLYLAIRVVNVRRAMSLLIRDQAEVVQVEDGRYLTHDFASWMEVSEFKRRFEADKHEWLRTVRTAIAVPRIIRLLDYDKLPAQDVKFNRRNIYARDGNRCQYCGRKAPTSELSLDHVVPRSRGGKSTWENIVCACLTCNVKKGGRTPDEAGLKLVVRPKKPKRSPLINQKIQDDRYASWRAFLDHAYWTVELK